MHPEPAFFEQHKIRRTFDEATETWWFSVVDIVQVLTQQTDNLTARKYWNKLKERLLKEGSEVVTNCHQLKMVAQDGKQRFTDAATAETLLRLVQSIPSPKAEPIKLWLAKVDHESGYHAGWAVDIRTHSIANVWFNPGNAHTSKGQSEQLYQERIEN